MAKRNIARTAIEGGRAKHCRWAEQEEDRQERRAFSIYCHMARLDYDLDEPANWKSSHDTGRAYRDFADKLRPVYRWLCAQVGRPWNEVFSEICQRFDKRSLAGRHIIGHIYGWVNVWREPGRYYKRVIYNVPYDVKKTREENEKLMKVIGHEWVRYSYWDFEINEEGILTCGRDLSEFYKRGVRCEK